jgi:predicted SAM-dependent methyltransferase
MKLNLGCGRDIRKGYVNVDLRDFPGVLKRNLIDELETRSRWDFDSDIADEILMIDFLEHIPYSKTEIVFQECWRILKVGGKLNIQTPDFQECAYTILGEEQFLCNKCGSRVQVWETECASCRQSSRLIKRAAMHRIFGGQDYEGNFHYNSFTKTTLREYLTESGFVDIDEAIVNENGETHQQNWNLFFTAKKGDFVWPEY